MGGQQKVGVATKSLPTDDQVTQLIKHFDNWFFTGEKRDRQLLANFDQRLYPYEKLFSPITINRLKIKNRLVMAPMGNINMAEETGRPNQQMIDYFIRRARGGVGLLTTGLIPVSHGIDPSVTEKDKLSYFPRLDRSRTVMSGWRALAQGVHAAGAHIFVQLTAGLGRVGNPQCLTEQFKFPVSASLNPNFYMPQIPCLPLSDRALRKIVKNMGQAAADAKALGLDGVYLHGHEGYLIEQLANRAFNRRKIGRYADPYRFGLDIVRTIRKRVGPNYPIMYRADLSLALNETYGQTVMSENPALAKFTNGRLPDETLEYLAQLVASGVDIFDVDLGSYDNWWLPHPPGSMPAGCFLDVAERVKDYLEEKHIISNAGVEVPVVAVGKLGYPDLAEQALRENQADMIMLGRPLLADPDWPIKAYQGRVSEIRPCIGCQEGCVNEFVEGGHPQCAVNPVTAFEYRGIAELAPAKRPKKVAVVGGGPAGIVAATTAAIRGHQVELFEASDKLCGRLQPGGQALIKYEIKLYRQYLQRQIKNACENYDLKISLNSPVKCDDLNGYDAIIVATGGIDAIPKIPGLDTVKTVQAAYLLANPDQITENESCLIIGGGAVGCETALWLAGEYGKKVSVLEMAPNFMSGVCTANRGHLIHAMRSAGVRLFNCAQVVNVDSQGVHAKIASKNVPNPYNTWTPVLPVNVENPLAKEPSEPYLERIFNADQVILALGGKPNNQLAFDLRAKRKAPEIHVIGDAFRPGLVFQAVKSAYQIGRTI